MQVDTLQAQIAVADFSLPGKEVDTAKQLEDSRGIQELLLQAQGEYRKKLQQQPELTDDLGIPPNAMAVSFCKFEVPCEKPLSSS